VRFTLIRIRDAPHEVRKGTVVVGLPFDASAPRAYEGAEPAVDDVDGSHADAALAGGPEANPYEVRLGGQRVDGVVLALGALLTGPVFTEDLGRPSSRETDISRVCRARTPVARGCGRSALTSRRSLSGQSMRLTA
jgi:hypothetical protein